MNQLIAQPQFPGKAGFIQRVIPRYRSTFFEMLAQQCEGGLALFAGLPLKNEGIAATTYLHGVEFNLGKNIQLFDPQSKFFLCWQSGLNPWLKKTQPDVLVVEANPRYLSTYWALRWMKRNGKPVIGWGLGAPRAAAYPDSVLGRWWGIFLRMFDALIAYSHNGASEYASVGFPKERVFVAPNAVAARPLHSPPKRKMKTNRLKILFVGRLQQRKRLDILFRACSMLPNSLRPEIVIVGDGPARQEFESLARQIYPKVTFVGEKYGDELAQYFIEAQLFVLPGTGGLAVQQAMSYALPVIVAEGDGTQRDYVRQENGWMITPGNVEHLKDVLIEALSDPIRLNEMGKASYRIVHDEINLEKMVEVFVAAMQSVRKMKQ